MGLCYSSGIKSGSSVHYYYGGKDIKTSSKVLSTTLPSTPQPQVEGEILESPNLKIIFLADLKTATNNFDTSNVLGEGGFGCVFKGYIDGHSLKASTPEKGMCIAVKMLGEMGCQGQQEWLTEIKCLGQLCHPNLVKLIGYCMEENYRFLVYEFMPRGSLEKHLYKRTGVSRIQTLAWDVRMNIALGAAKGLAFLHNEAQLIHRDFKTSNILLDSNYNAKISGLGKAKDGPMGDKSHVSTWTIDDRSGYAAPEYKFTGHLTTKADVYSLGVVLLELITGRSAILDHDHYIEGSNLVDWARPRLLTTNLILRVVDARLEGKYEVSGVLKAAKLAFQCLSRQPRIRPDIEQVVKALGQITLGQC